MTISYQNFQPDWWAGIGAAAESVKIAIEDAINTAFGDGGIPAIQRQAIIDVARTNFDYQPAMKGAAAAAQDAARYADLPNSPLYQNAIATQRAYERIASNSSIQAAQIIKSAGTDVALVSNMRKLGSLLGPAINIIDLGEAASSGDAFVVAERAITVLAGMAIGGAVVATLTLFGLPTLAAGGLGIAAGFGGSKSYKWMGRLISMAFKEAMNSVFHG
jgi:hypothetical protein